MDVYRPLLVHAVAWHDHGAVGTDDFVRAFLEWWMHFIVSLFDIIYDVKNLIASVAILSASQAASILR